MNKRYKNIQKIVYELIFRICKPLFIRQLFSASNSRRYIIKSKTSKINFDVYLQLIIFLFFPLLLFRFYINIFGKCHLHDFEKKL